MKIEKIQKELEKRVDKIIEMSGDAEAAHSAEDELHLELIEEFCPEWIVKEVKRLSYADFQRWCA